MTSSWKTWSVALLLLGTISGCGGSGSKRKLVQVSGTVTFEGKPLTSGTITFVAEGPSPVNAAGEISKSGTYTLSTERPGDGASPGTYKIRIESWASPPKMDETGVDPGKSAVPEKYNRIETSGLTATVKESPATQKVDFALVP